MGLEISSRGKYRDEIRDKEPLQIENTSHC